MFPNGFQRNLVSSLCLCMLALPVTNRVIADTAGTDHETISPEQLVSWSAAQQQRALKSFATLYATRVIARGRTVSSLREGPEVHVRFQFAGKSYDTDSFMSTDLVAGLLILKNGTIVLERYARGLGPNDKWASFSVEKSFVSTLIGAAILDGHIASVGDNASRYLPSLGGTPLDGATLENFLQMSSGMQWNEEYGDSPDIDFVTQTWAHRRAGVLLPYIASHPRAWAPGSRFQYNSANTQVLVEAVAAATRMSPSVYLSEKLWKPLGMQSDANWQLDGDNGMEAGSISATLRDYGRFGLFMANDGIIQGTRVLPQGWIAKAAAGSNANPGYGYAWWLDGGGAFSARGLHGQVVYVDPPHHLVGVILAVETLPGEADARPRVAAFFQAATRALDGQ
jgi:CubicO group peptidase (beta-lactamase class C family)